MGYGVLRRIIWGQIKFSLTIAVWCLDERSTKYKTFFRHRKCSGKVLFYTSWTSFIFACWIYCALSQICSSCLLSLVRYISQLRFSLKCRVANVYAWVCFETREEAEETVLRQTFAGNCKITYLFLCNGLCRILIASMGRINADSCERRSLTYGFPSS